jgi:hypothetical protein
LIVLPFNKVALVSMLTSTTTHHTLYFSSTLKMSVHNLY